MGDPLSAEPLRIHHVVSDIHRKDAGPSYSVPRLAEALSAHGAEVHLHTLEPRPEHDPKVDTTYYGRSHLVRSLGVSLPMRTGLHSAARNADIMHFHGLWTMSTVYAGSAVKGTDCILAMSPRGMLEPWARNWHSNRKDLFSLAFQKRVLDRVALFHATSNAEANSIRDAGFTAPIAIAPIGIDLPQETDRSRGRDGRRHAVYLGRLHPKKNVEALIEAWSSISSRHPEWSLTIAGPGESSYEADLRRLIARSDRVKMPGPAYGAAKAELLRTADLFVLPSHSENFGIVVAEALSYGIPVIATVGTPWHGLVTEKCGWWAEPTSEALSFALDQAMALGHETLYAMGRRGRDWVTRDFSWFAVGHTMHGAYEWMRRGGPTPPSVRET